jgi:uncharacterized protein
MPIASRPFQVLVKPIGPVCNLACSYCYYLKTAELYPKAGSFRMPDDILEEYIHQHIYAYPDPVIRFSWHGGEPTMLGVHYFRKIVEIQKRYKPPGKQIVNGIQTNGTLLTEEWCRFLAEEGFSVGLSVDGTPEMHDKYRITRGGAPTHEHVMQGYSLLRQENIVPDILCVVNAHNVRYPIEVYRFFKEMGVQYIGFLPLVVRQPGAINGVTRDSVPAKAYGEFLCAIFDEWRDLDIGKIKVQVFEEAAKTALGEEHEVCIFRKTCGDVPVIEYNGDFFSCDHFMDTEHHLGNIMNRPLIDLLESPEQIAFGQNKYHGLPRYCQECNFLSLCNGECPKNRFILAPDGEEGLNYLCAGYKLFFGHCRPFLDELANLGGRQTTVWQTSPVEAGSNQGPAKLGRNDPSACGSGKNIKGVAQGN